MERRPPAAMGISPGNSVLIDLVQPFTQRVGVEEHIAHVIITQRPMDLNSVLFSMVFVDEVAQSVVVPFAVAVPRLCSARDIADRIPLFDAFFLNRRNWVHPEVDNEEQAIVTRYGLGIGVQIFADLGDNIDEMSDSSSLIQSYPSALPVQNLLRSSCDAKQWQQDRLHAAKAKGHMPTFDNFSLTEEFIRYIQAIGNQEAQANALPDLPDGLNEQPTWVQDLWEKWAETIAQTEGDPQTGPRLETWFTNPRRWTRCDHSRIVDLSTNFHQWERELLNAWHDRTEIALPTHFAIVFPTPEDVDRTVQEQLVIEQQSEPFSRTVVVTVYDTHRSNGRHGSIALVVSDQLHIRSLITLLGYSGVCPPEREDSECLLWMGNIAIRPDQTLHVRTGNALRFLVRRGTRVSIEELLSMSDQQLRNELRAAIGGAVFRRPNVQGFPADPHSADNPESTHAVTSSQSAEYPPDWLNQLQEVFDRSAFLEQSEEGPVLYVLVWFIQGMNMHSNDAPRVVRLDSDTQWWRSEIVFPWRDHFVRAAPIDLHFVDPMPPRHPWQSHAAHIIITQDLPREHVGVLVTTIIQESPNSPISQVALMVHSFSGVRDLVDRVADSDVTIDGILVRRGRQVFPPDHTVRIGPGDGLVIERFHPVQASEAAVDTTMMSIHEDSEAVEQTGIQGNDVVSADDSHDQGDSDATLLLQCSNVVRGSALDHVVPDEKGGVFAPHGRSVDQTDHVDSMQSPTDDTQGFLSKQPPLSAKEAPPCCGRETKNAVGHDDALGIDSDTMQETSFFQFNPNAAEFLPQGDELPEWAQVIEEIYHVWDSQASAWQGESRAAHFMTWYVAPNAGRLQCLYGRKIVFFVDLWNWREQIRRIWMDEVDQGADFQLVLVSPPPTQMEPGIAGHIIVIQHNSPEWSSLILSTFDPAINGGHPFHIALSFQEQLQLQEVLTRSGYTLECAHHAQCVFRLRSQLFGSTDRIRVSDGDAIDLIVNRHFLPANWNPPFIPHAPGAEGLALLQTKAKIVRKGPVSASDGVLNDNNQAQVISIHNALQQTVDEIEGMPFTLAEFVNQKQVQQHDLAVCVWEVHDGNNHFELHPKKCFDAEQICRSFQIKHNLIRKCSDLYNVTFSRQAWKIPSNCWYIGSTTPVPTHKALVACVIYHKGCASVKVVTLPQRGGTDWFRDVLNVVHGTFVRVNGAVIQDVVALKNGDVLEYHSKQFPT